MKSVLIVEDEIDFAEQLSAFLSSNGFTVDHVTNGRRGLKILDEKEYDVILTDVLMPDMDGFELAIILRKRHLTNKLIVMSGGGRLEKEFYLKTVTKLGAVHTLSKPFKLDELLEKVNTVANPKL